MLVWGRKLARKQTYSPLNLEYHDLKLNIYSLECSVESYNCFIQELRFSWKLFNL